MTWSLQQVNLGGNTNGPKAVGDPFVSVYNGQQHVAYRAEDGAIWDAWFDPGGNSWNLQKINLGGDTDGVLAARNRLQPDRSQGHMPLSDCDEGGYLRSRRWGGSPLLLRGFEAAVPK